VLIPRIVHNCRPTVISFVFSILGLATVGLWADCLKYQPVTVALAGTISVRDAFGPPGYGEDPKHDKKEKYLLLTLDAPICVEGNPKDDANSQSESNVTAVQMLYLDKHPFHKKWLNKHVSVTGTLFHAITGHHRTPVLIEVTQTRP
jgi:hypothetical protein